MKPIYNVIILSFIIIFQFNSGSSSQEIDKAWIIFIIFYFLFGMYLFATLMTIFTEPGKIPKVLLLECK